MGRVRIKQKVRTGRLPGLLNKKVKSLVIKDGMFFKEDFMKLPKNTVIYIKSGKLIW